MRNRVYSSVVFIILLLMFNSFAFAQSPQITNGLTWLYSAQTATGNWLEVAATDYYSTAAALDAIYSVDPSSPASGPAFQWLSSQIVSPTDYLSRQIIALKRAGQDTSGSVVSLLLYRNADGGFGGAEDCPNSYILDTALALQALKAADYSDTTVQYQAINFLTTNQNADGGWGFYPSTGSGQVPSDPSNAYVTAIVLRSLSGYSSTFSVQSSMVKAAAFLLAKQTQNNDGGFGSSPSTVYETALSLMALIESGQGSTQQIQSAVNYIVTTQSTTNGSWNNDPYSTALALQALANIRPNLMVSSLSLSKSMPKEGESITITALVGNTGFEDAANVLVRFYSGDPSTGSGQVPGGTQIGTDQIIPSLTPNSSTPVSITASFTGTGSKTIFVVVDPSNTISETSKTDNRASARLWVATGPDLAIFSEDIKPSTSVPAAGTPFTLDYVVRNLGESSTGGFDVAVYDGQPSGTPLQTIHISGINGTEVRTGSIGITLATNGQHTLSVMADAGSLIQEISKTNNIGTVIVNVGATLTGADLVVTQPDITITPSRPHAGDAVQVSARVRNQGAEAAFGFLVEFYDNAPEAGGTLIGSQSLSLASGVDQIITTNWTITSGIHTVYVVVDRQNTVIEADKNNNRASIRVMTDMVDISLSATDLVFTPSHPVNGDAVVLSITTHNTGIKNTGAFNLALYDGPSTCSGQAPESCGTLLQTFPISNIPGDGSATITYTFTASPQTYRFYAVADTENTVIEMYEDNNTAIRSLKIKAPGEILGPDLVPIKIDLTDTATDPQTLAISGTAHVTFQNKGDDKITTPFNIIIFEDRDNDGHYTQGVDNLLSTATNTLTIWPQGAGMLDLPLSGTVQFLHSPLYSFLDSGDVILEQDETNNVMVSCKDCQVNPSNSIASDIEVKWRWKQFPTTYNSYRTITPPAIANLGPIDGKNIPAVVFVTGHENDYILANYYQGRLWALRGDTGAQLFTYYDMNHGPMAASYVAAADIDGDGISEIIVNGRPSNAVGGNFIAIDNKGNLKWDNLAMAQAWNAQGGSYSGYASGPVSIADIDADGKPEIISGKTVINGDGSIKWGNNYYGLTGTGYFGSSQVVDLDMDGKQEIVAGYTAYKPLNRDPLWNHPEYTQNTSYDAFTAIANLDGGMYPEIVMVSPLPSNAALNLVEHDGARKWGPVRISSLPGANQPFAGNVAPPTIADFDGDGELEIGIMGNGKYFILNKNGYPKLTLDVPGYNTQPIAATVFDLYGDGRPKVLIHTSGFFRIFDGKSGQLLFEDSFGAGGMQYQTILVADVNGDGETEIVVIGYDPSNDPIKSRDAIRVYGSKNHDWVGARKIWNQPGYHVTNVNDDGTIPQHEAPSWLLNNTYHTQAAIGLNPNPYLTPNLTASYMRIEQAGSSLNLAVRVGNGGAIASSPTITVTFYDGNPVSGGTVIGTTSTTRALNPGDYQDVVYSWSGGSLGLHHLYAVVDAANAISECRKDDNQVNADFTIQTSYADLKIGQEDITLPAGPYTAGIPVTITANVKNSGTLSASNIAVRMYYGNPSAGGTQIGYDQVIPGINAGSSLSLVFTYDTTGKSGTNVLYIVVDPANTIIESSKANNTAAITLTVQPPTLPDLAITPSDIQVSPATLHEGNTASITAAILNLGVSAGNIPVRMSVRSGEFGVGSEVYSETKTIYPILSLGQTAMVTATFDTTGLVGQQSIVVTIDPGNSITESRKDNNSASKSFFVQSSGLNALVTLDKTAYQADDIVTATIAAGDTTGNARSLTLGLYVQDSAGNRIATISSTNPVTINPNSVAALSRTWNTGAALNGQYTIIAELAESGQVISRKSAGLTVLPDMRVSAQVTTDKISYNPNETAALTAAATSQSRNYIFEKITATLTIGAQQSAVYTDTKTITTLMPGATFTFKTYCNTGTLASGTYPVTLTVRDSTNAIIATGTQNLTISSIVKPTAVLRGRISVSGQELLTGDTTTVSYTVTNVGNIDLQNFSLSVLAVNASDQTVYNTFTCPATLAMGGSVSNTLPVTTTDYTAKDYLVVLRANIAGQEETLAGTYFRIEGVPSAPSLAAPAMNADVETFTPTLSANNASDPNDDKLTYEFELYNDSGLTQLVASSGVVTEGTGITSWSIPISLVENQTYFWRSRAYDNWLYGPWMQAASFRVNTVNDPPTAPTIASPVDATLAATFTPTLSVNNATDPDSPGLTYNFVVALDPGFTQLVSAATGVTSGLGVTSWQVPVSLTENTFYYWRAQADDWLITGPWSAAASFFVNTTNEAPTAPVIITPTNNATVPSLSTDITITNSTDPDSPVVTYFFELDTNATFDSLNIIRSNGVAQGQGTTTWHVTGLQEDTQCYVRAKASDGQASSTWSNPVGFFVNAVNELPAIPTLANPSNGAGVTVHMPALSIHDSTDPDRDVLTYDFEVYRDAALTSLMTGTTGVVETAQITSWTVPISLTENQTYYWRARASDGTLASDWMPAASFMVNTANDAPGAPTLYSPQGGSTITTLNPTLSVVNATDPDSPSLTYSFEVYSGTTLVTSIADVPGDNSGITTATISAPLTDNTVYQWRSRVYDGNLFSPWTGMTNFTVHLTQTSIIAEIEFEPETLNKKSEGSWVKVDIELPHGYSANDIDISSIRLEGTVHAELWPCERKDHYRDHGCDHDHHGHSHSEITVKFKRGDVIAALPVGDHVPVHVTGKVGPATFEGVDIIRVMK